MSLSPNLPKYNKPVSWFSIVLTILIFEIWGGFLFAAADGIGAGLRACEGVFSVGAALLIAVASVAIQFAYDQFYLYLLHPILILSWCIAVGTGLSRGKPRLMLIFMLSALGLVAIQVLMFDFAISTTLQFYGMLLGLLIQVGTVALCALVSKLMW